MTDFSLEKAAMARGCAAVCGCDEAGAGPLMGPVYAAAVILPVDGCIPGLDDSKKLTEKKREALFAINALAIPADYALIDGNRDHGRSSAITTPHETVVGGDGRSASIAAASVLAKVSRDRYVCRVLDPLYPQYQFAKHKGYGTKLHYAMLDQYGPCPEHRMSFLTKWKERRT